MQRNDTVMNEQIENIGMKTQHTNSTFGFLPTRRKFNPKNQKSYFLPTLKQSIQL